MGDGGGGGGLFGGFVRGRGVGGGLGGDGFDGFHMELLVGADFDVFELDADLAEVLGLDCEGVGEAGLDVFEDGEGFLERGSGHVNDNKIREEGL